MNKLIEEIRCLGCPSINDATLCACTYLELLRRQHSKRMFDVSYHYNSKIGKLYCQARTSENGLLNLFVPVSSSVVFEHQIWEDYFSLITDLHEPNSLVLAIWENDCTFVLYEVSKGLGSPPGVKSMKDPEQDKSFEQNKDDMPSTSAKT